MSTLVNIIGYVVTRLISLIALRLTYGCFRTLVKLCILVYIYVPELNL